MATFKNAMELFKLLDKSNCKQCNKPTCLAFAGAVFTGQADLAMCPRLPPHVIDAYSGNGEGKASREKDAEAMMEALKAAVAEVDLAARSDQLGGVFKNNRLILKCMGKDIGIGTDGTVYTDLHVNPWIVVPVFDYVLKSNGLPVAGQWISFRELSGGRERLGLYIQRCEQPLKRIADTWTDLFEDLIHLFNGTVVENHYQSDISLVLYPLPKVPVLICYWKPEEAMDSDLKLFFDTTIESHIGSDAVYTLVAGLVTMFEKLSLRHGV